MNCHRQIRASHRISVYRSDSIAADTRPKGAKMTFANKTVLGTGASRGIMGYYRILERVPPPARRSRPALQHTWVRRHDEYDAR